MFSNEEVQTVYVAGSNWDGDPATEADLVQWANTYGITGPVLTDPLYGGTSGYSSLGMGTPHVAFIRPGMILDSVRPYTLEEILALLEADGVTP